MEMLLSEFDSEHDGTETGMPLNHQGPGCQNNDGFLSEGFLKAQSLSYSAH